MAIGFNAAGLRHVLAAPRKTGYWPPSVLPVVGNGLVAFPGKNTSTGSLALKKFTEAIPKVSTLTDGFIGSSLDATKWTGSWGTFSITGGQCVFTTATSAGNSGFDSKARYDLTGSALSTQLVTAGNPALASLETYLCWLYADSNNRLFWLVNSSGGVLYIVAISETAGATSVLYSAAYSSANHKYFRIREASGTIYWDTSADGLSWNNATTLATPFSVGSLGVQLQVGTYGTEASGTTVVLDNVNLFTVTGTGSLALKKLSSHSTSAVFGSTGSLALKKLTHNPSFFRNSNAEGGTNGVAVTTGNSGTSGDAFTSVNAPSPVTYDNAQAFDGSQSYKIVSSANFPGCWWSVVTNSPSLYTRFYIQWQSVFAGSFVYVAASGYYFNVVVAGGVIQADLGVNTTNGVTTLSPGVWYRVEVQFNMAGPTSTSSMVVRLYNSAGTLLETISVTSPVGGSYKPTDIQFGGEFGTTGTKWMDGLAVSDQGWIGTSPAAATQVTETFTGTGSLALKKLSESGTALAGVIGTGSLALKKLSGSGTEAETFSCSGGLALRKLAESGTAAEVFSGTGSLAEKKLAESGTALAGVIGTGSLALRKASLAGTETETFTSSGSLSLIKRGLSATGAETFTSTGSLALRKLSESAAGLVVVGRGSLSLQKLSASGTAAQAFTCTGSLGLKKLSLSTAEAETFAATGQLSLRKLSELATGTYTPPPISGTGSLARRRLSGTGTFAEAFTSTGTITLHPLALSSTGKLTYASTGTLRLRKPLLAAQGSRVQPYLPTQQGSAQVAPSVVYTAVTAEPSLDEPQAVFATVQPGPNTDVKDSRTLVSVSQ